MSINNYMSSRPFTFKYTLSDFTCFKEVREIIKEIEAIDKKNRAQYIEKKNIKDKLTDIYWTRIYGSVEIAEEAFDILSKTLWDPSKLLNKEELAKNIKEYTDKSKTENLYIKIISTCPNGDSVVDFLIQDLLT